MIKKLCLLILITLFLGCHVIWEPHYRAPAGTWRPPAGFYDWLNSSGLFNYGMTLKQAEEILANKSFCGERFKIKEIEWPLINQKPPASGPYYGIYHIQEGGTSPNFCALLISNGAVMEYGAYLTAFGAQWTPLIGQPKLINHIKERMNQGEERFAEIYWRCENEVKGYLKEQHSEDELYSFLKRVQKEVPVGLMEFCTATESYHLFGNYPGEKPFIQCEIESKISWHKIVAIRLGTNGWVFFKDNGDPIEAGPIREVRKENPNSTSWELDLFADVYINEGEIIGVAIREPNYYPCLPFPITKLIGYDEAGYYPRTTIYCWTFSK